MADFSCPVNEGTTIQKMANHSKTRPFEKWTKVDHSNTGHIWYSDPHCTYLTGIVNHAVYTLALPMLKNKK